MVSVIITAYNYDKYVERCLRSVLDQSLPRNQYEIIVVNDGSTDKTKQILENYTDVARIFNLEKNIGLPAARNFGIKKARGQFVVFIDIDDYIQHDMLLIQKIFLTENNRIDAVSVDYYLVDELGNHLEHVNAEERPIACGIMFRKDYLFNIGLYDETFLAREDEDFRIRFLEKYNIYNIILPLYRYRRHESNLTSKQHIMDEFKKKLTEKHGEKEILLMGEKIYLRKLTLNDVTHKYLSWLQEPEVMSGIAKNNYTLNKLNDYVKSKINSKNVFFFAICDKENNNHIGNIKMEMVNDLAKVADLGVLIGEKKYWGKGIGYEACSLLINFGFNELKLKKIFLAVFDNNPNAIKLYKKLGFQLEGTLKQHVFVNGKYYDKHIMSIFNKNHV